MLGVVLIGLGATFLKMGHVGLDPFTALNVGMSNHLGMELGTYQLSVNIIIFIFVLILDRKQIGIGTFFNMVLVGYEIQWFSTIYNAHVAERLHIPLIIVDALVGILLFTLGTSFYMSVDLGVAPYDAIAPIIVERSKHAKYQWVRSSQDILFMIAGVIAGGIAGGDVGIMTIVVAFFAGPLINFWNLNVSRDLIDQVNRFSHQDRKINEWVTGIVHAGKYGAILTRSAYRHTSFVQQHMSGYTDAEIREMIRRTRNSLRRNAMVRHTIDRRYDSLMMEAGRRHIKVR
ncbi:MAG: membrane protein [Acetilactobacillus jinshanensis]